MRWRKSAHGRRLEVHHLQRLFRAFNDGWIVRDQPAVPKREPRGEHSARGEELKEFAAAGVHVEGFSN
jgi:hypothetical protein